MRRLALLAFALAIAGCGPKPGEGPPPDDNPPVTAQKPAADPPLTGEPVVKFTFKTASDPKEGNGDVYIKLFPADAPKTCAHIFALVKKGYYKGILVHRVELKSEFKLTQFGNAGTENQEATDPANLGTAVDPGSGSTVPLEVNKHKHVRGAVGMARTPDPNSGDSQMYICFVNIPNLDPEYTVFGQVTKGLDVAEGLGLGSKVTDCAVVKEK